MTVDDRLALELGRAVLRAVLAEAQVAQLQAQAAAPPPAEEEPPRARRRGAAPAADTRPR